MPNFKKFTAPLDEHNSNIQQVKKINVYLLPFWQHFEDLYGLLKTYQVLHQAVPYLSLHQQ